MHLKSLASPQAFAALFDHTLLKPNATPSEIRTLCTEAMTHGFKGVCVNPAYVSLAARELKGSQQLPMAVIGFPLGANRSDIKIDEALRAIGDGARELDMVINLGFYLGGERVAARHDLVQVIRAAHSVPVKVIIETAYLQADEITELTHWCMEIGAAFVKTSTGFAPRGASVEDVAIMARAIGGASIGIKASGGIRTLASALALVEAGATRLGSSNSVKILSDFQDAAAKLSL